MSDTTDDKSVLNRLMKNVAEKASALGDALAELLGPESENAIKEAAKGVKDSVVAKTGETAEKTKEKGEAAAARTKEAAGKATDALKEGAKNASVYLKKAISEATETVKLTAKNFQSDFALKRLEKEAAGLQSAYDDMMKSVPEDDEDAKKEAEDLHRHIEELNDAVAKMKAKNESQ